MSDMSPRCLYCRKFHPGPEDFCSERCARRHAQLPPLAPPPRGGPTKASALQGAGILHGRALAAVAITAATTVTVGMLAYWLADGILEPLLTHCTAGTPSMFLPSGIDCTHPGNQSAAAIGCIAALVGFWFAWTGRLVRLFHKV